ncbi:hypothetical protein FDECE_11093 [Fusarium decemcellulare]|nr:hypothetical protein FDECE_11093 [Fusarium decemcellulare]
MVSSSQSSLKAIARPRQQSGQITIRQIYKHVERLAKGNNRVKMIWAPSRNDHFTTCRKAKRQAKKATKAGCTPESPPYQARSTRTSLATSQSQRQRALPDRAGSYSKRIDRALPSEHTKALYDGLKRRKADMLSQLRTGTARINSYLCKIGAAESDMCECGRAPETMEHFLFRCTRWETEHEVMRQVGQSMMGNLSYLLGGKAASYGTKWAPNLQAPQFTDQASAAEDGILNTWRCWPSSRPVEQSSSEARTRKTPRIQSFSTFDNEVNSLREVDDELIDRHLLILTCQLSHIGPSGKYWYPDDTYDIYSAQNYEDGKFIGGKRVFKESTYSRHRIAELLGYKFKDGRLIGCKSTVGDNECDSDEDDGYEGDSDEGDSDEGDSDEDDGYEGDIDEDDIDEDDIDEGGSDEGANSIVILRDLARDKILKIAQERRARVSNSRRAKALDFVISQCENGEHLSHIPTNAVLADIVSIAEAEQLFRGWAKLMLESGCRDFAAKICKIVASVDRPFDLKKMPKFMADVRGVCDEEYLRPLHQADVHKHINNRRQKWGEVTQLRDAERSAAWINGAVAANALLRYMNLSHWVAAGVVNAFPDDKWKKTTQSLRWYICFVEGAFDGISPPYPRAPSRPSKKNIDHIIKRWEEGKDLPVVEEKYRLAWQEAVQQKEQLTSTWQSDRSIVDYFMSLRETWDFGASP